MYSQIVCPQTKIRYNINSISGQNILSNYLNELDGGSNKFRSYDCRIGKEGIDGKKIDRSTCNKQYDPLGYDKIDNYSGSARKKLIRENLVNEDGIVSRCKLTSNNVCRKRQSASVKRGKRNWKIVGNKLKLINELKSDDGLDAPEQVPELPEMNTPELIPTMDQISPLSPINTPEQVPELPEMNTPELISTMDEISPLSPINSPEQISDFPEMNTPETSIKMDQISSSSPLGMLTPDELDETETPTPQTIDFDVSPLDSPDFELSPSPVLKEHTQSIDMDSPDLIPTMDEISPLSPINSPEQISDFPEMNTPETPTTMDQISSSSPLGILTPDELDETETPTPQTIDFDVSPLDSPDFELSPSPVLKDKQVVVANCQRLGDKYDMLKCQDKEYPCLTPEGECSNKLGDRIRGNKLRCASGLKHSQNCEMKSKDYPCITKEGLCASRDGEIEKIPDFLKEHRQSIDMDTPKVIPTMDEISPLSPINTPEPVSEFQEMDTPELYPVNDSLIASSPIRMLTPTELDEVETPTPTPIDFDISPLDENSPDFELSPDPITGNKQIVVANCQRLGDKYDMLKCQDKEYPCLTPEGECSNRLGDRIRGNKLRCASGLRHSQNCEMKSKDYPCITKNGLCASVDGNLEKIPDFLKYNFLPKEQIVIPGVVEVKVNISDKNPDELAIVPYKSQEIVVLNSTNKSYWQRLSSGFSSAISGTANVLSSVKTGTTKVLSGIATGVGKALRVTEAIYNEVSEYKRSNREVLRDMTQFMSRLAGYLSNRGSSGAILKGDIIKTFGFLGGKVYREMNRETAIDLNICDQNGDMDDLSDEILGKYRYEFAFSYKTDDGKYRIIDQVQNLNRIERESMDRLNELIREIGNELNEDIPNSLAIQNLYLRCKNLIIKIKNQIETLIRNSAKSDLRDATEFELNIGVYLEFSKIFDSINSIKVATEQLHSISERLNKDFNEIKSDYDLSRSMEVANDLSGILMSFVR